MACIITPETKEIRTFSAMTDDLTSMVDWLKNKGCTHVAMESTGSFWKPIYNLLELEGIQALVVNAKRIKNVPDAKPMSQMRNGLPVCSATASFKAATFPYGIKES